MGCNTSSEVISSDNIPEEKNNNVSSNQDVTNRDDTTTDKPIINIIPPEDEEYKGLSQDIIDNIKKNIELRDNSIKLLNSVGFNVKLNINWKLISELLINSNNINNIGEFIYQYINSFVNNAKLLIDSSNIYLIDIKNIFTSNEIKFILLDDNNEIWLNKLSDDQNIYNYINIIDGKVEIITSISNFGTNIDACGNDLELLIDNLISNDKKLPTSTRVNLELKGNQERESNLKKLNDALGETYSVDFDMLHMCKVLADLYSRDCVKNFPEMVYRDYLGNLATHVANAVSENGEFKNHFNSKVTSRKIVIAFAEELDRHSELKIEDGVLYIHIRERDGFLTNVYNVGLNIANLVAPEVVAEEKPEVESESKEEDPKVEDEPETVVKAEAPSEVEDFQVVQVSSD